ncbi:O-methyltransferase [Nesterenkonia rhizosphaerae]|uniref:Class I SAM-dependent methyltransferase n=1 Tax=Nesterenkonia rhizosphaerae TaxID=1348272 RepID=A0ABP9FNC8_9MICC
MKALSPIQRLNAGVLLLGLLVGSALILLEAWQWAALAGLLLIALVGWTTVMTTVVTNRAAKRSLDSKRAAQRTEQLARQLSDHAADSSQDISSELRDSVQRLSSQLLPVLKSTHEHSKDSAEYSRKALTRLRNDLPEISGAIRELDHQFVDFKEQLTQSQKRLMNRVRADVSPVAPALESMEARVEKSERRLLGAYEGERLAQHDRWEGLQGHLHALADTLRVHGASVHDIAAQVTNLGEKSHELEKKLQCFLKQDAVQEDENHTLIANFESALARSRDRLMSRVQVAVREETRQVESLMQLLPQIQPRAILPPSGRWAMDARALLHLSDLVRNRQPKNIVELGGGTSTVWLGYLCESYGGKVVSIDHDEHFAEITRSSVHRHGLHSTAEVRTAPLEEIQVNKQVYRWYQTTALEDLKDIDLLVVDGPPASSGKDARLPAVPHLISKLSPRCLIVLDDAEREDEREVLDAWAKDLPDLERIDYGVSRLGVLAREVHNG